MVKFSRYFFLWIGAASLTWQFYAADEISLAQISLAAALLWTLGLLQRWKRIPRFGAILFALGAILGFYRELPFGWMLATALFAYLSYDLSKFALRLDFATRGKEDIALITRVHLSRVALMMLMGISISSYMLFTQGQLDFAWGILIGLLLAWWGIVIVKGKQ
jgi:hypothetical protein